MNETVFFLIVGIFLIVVVLHLLSQTGRESTEQLPRTGAESSPLELWPREQGERILGHSDWDYVYENARPEVQRLFCAERKALALAWLYEVRRRSQALMRAHRIRSSMSDSIRIPLEFRLLLDYAVLRISCESAVLIIFFSSPTVLRRAVRWTGGVMNRVRSLSESSLRVNALLGGIAPEFSKERSSKHR